MPRGVPRAGGAASVVSDALWCGARAWHPWRASRGRSRPDGHVRIAYALPRARGVPSGQCAARARGQRGARCPRRTCPLVAQGLGCGSRGHCRVWEADGVLTRVAADAATGVVCAGGSFVGRRAAEPCLVSTQWQQVGMRSARARSAVWAAHSAWCAACEWRGVGDVRCALVRCAGVTSLACRRRSIAVVIATCRSRTHCRVRAARRRGRARLVPGRVPCAVPAPDLPARRAAARVRSVATAACRKRVAC